MTINERIKKRRKELRLSLKQVGDACGLNKSTISKYENGIINDMSASLVIQFSKTLKCSVLYLLGIVDDPRPLKVEYKEEDWWDKKIGTRDFSEEEQKELIEYAEYLIYKRNKK